MLKPTSCEQAVKSRAREMKRNAMLEFRIYKRENGEGNLHYRRPGTLPVISESRIIHRKETGGTPVLLILFLTARPTLDVAIQADRFAAKALLCRLLTECAALNFRFRYGFVTLQHHSGIA